MPKVTMPQLGESVAEGTIGKWLKKVGDHVDKYEPIVEVITDKVNAEVPSPFAGTLREILVQEGETVPNNTEIAIIDAAGEGVADAAAPAPAPAAESPAAATQPPTVAAQAPAAAQSPAAAPSPTPIATVPAPPAPEPTVLGTGSHGPAGSDERMAPAAALDRSAGNGAVPEPYEGRMTPAVRRLAREHGVDLALITGTGHDGRVTRDDVMRFVESGGAAGQATAAAAPAPSAPSTSPTPMPAAAAAPGRPRTDSLKPMTPMRKAIAKHMVESKTTVPHAYTTVEVDMSGVVALREAIKGQYQAREGVSLSFVAIIGKAVVEALQQHPDINAHWTADGLLRKANINLGVAVAVEDGLVVPVIHDADRYSIHGLNLFVADLGSRARSNKLKLEDIQGGTFTLNNTGWFGSVSSQPIVNVPEVAILSMEAIVKRPVVIETPGGDTIGIRPMMNVCVSFDHRATDGAQIGSFVADVKKWLESTDAQTPVW